VEPDALSRIPQRRTPRRDRRHRLLREWTIGRLYVFDPDESARSLGTFAILSQIAIARERGLPHVYLGFWIDGHPKMDYKKRYRPLEILDSGAWKTLESA
jgi:arginyl-tRNA--protein-N-Asp/Glu arginylyltransferase